MSDNSGLSTDYGLSMLHFRFETALAKVQTRTHMLWHVFYALKG